MLKTPIARGVALAALGTTMMLPSFSQAAFLEDSKATLELRNFYFNRDFRQPGGSGGQSKQDEWAQGFILKYESGYTDGIVGFGVDAIGLLGTKLNSGKGSSGSGLLPVNGDKNGADNYGSLNGTLKMRLSKTVFRYGTLIPVLPVLDSNDSRLLPQTFRGGEVTMQEIKDLTLKLGRLDRTTLRNSSDTDKMTMNTGGKRITGATTSDRFDYAHVNYQWTPNLSTSYSYAHLNNNYHQSYFNVKHVLPIMEGHSLKSDLRFARSTDDGQTNVDNRAFGAMFTYQMRSHKFGVGYQKMTGDTGFAYLGGGTNPYLVNYVQIGDFANADEKSWQVRYDYDFAALGIPGLTFMTRYVSGRDIDRGVSRKGEEWERNTDIGYVFQGGVLKNLGVKWRNATFRSNMNGNDLDENRLIVSYTIPLL